MDASFIPKSNVKLSRGDYAFLERPDGRQAILVYLAPVGTMRSAIWGALLTAVTEQRSLPPGAGRLPIAMMALMHIQVFAKNAAPIVGNLDARLDQADVERRLQATTQVNRVCGWQAVARIAGELPLDVRLEGERGGA